MSERVGRKLGKYDILEEIGQGGFATVYKARDTTLERIVALKILRSELLHDPVFVQRFEEEAKLAAQLEHPNIVRVYEVGELQGIHYLTMEYVDGQSLAEVLQVRGQLTTQQALKITQEVAAALDAAHRRGMIHRDIKPSNILIRKDGAVLLTDFGLAKAVAASFAASLTSTSQIIGTLRYMSPEQAEEKPLDQRADLYSLGVVLYEMLAGRPPFLGDTAIQMIRAHADKAPPPPSQFNKAITPAVESVILRTLAKDPGQRYPSAGQMARALEKATIRGVAAELPPARKETKTPRRGRSVVVFAALAVFLCLIAIGGGALLAMRNLGATPTPVVHVTEPVAQPTPTWTVVEPGSTPPPTNLPSIEPTGTEAPEPSDTPPPAATDTPPPTATLPPRSPTMAGDAGMKAVGEAYQANGISLTLMAYDIKSDGRIWLKFAIANQGSSKALLRYQNSYFSVSDETGKAYPQEERYLLDAKQAELSAGETYEITSDSYPDSYRSVGYFHGIVPEQAGYLTVKVSQFADLRDMQWQIPLNAQLSSPQSPAAGSQQPLLEGFSANGITVLLSAYDIKTDGRIWLKFLIRNEGSHAVLLRTQNKYFEVYDDLGNRYDQEPRYLLDAKQVLLTPGQSYEITSDSYPDSHRNIGYFHGMIPERVSHLTVKVSQFADLREMQWQIPLNAQLSRPQSPSAGSQQPLLDGFSANGITVLLSDYSIKTDGRIWLKFLVRNEGSNAVLLRTQNKYFGVYDDLGNRYDQEQRYLLDAKQVLLTPGQSYEITSDSYPDSYRSIGYFHGMVPEQASHLVVEISQFADLRDMQWRIPLD